MRAQLKRATERYGSLNSRKFFHALSQPMDKEGSNTNDEVIVVKQDHVPESIDSKGDGAEQTINLERSRSSSLSSGVCQSNNVNAEGQENSAGKSMDEIKQPDALAIPVDFLCPISLELMRDPVIVATGQVIHQNNPKFHLKCIYYAGLLN